MIILHLDQFRQIQIQCGNKKGLPHKVNKQKEMKNIVKPLKSASLIITRSKKSQTTHFDYQILMMKRKARPPWGSILVFPGGLYDKQHDDYLEQKFNFSSPLQVTALRQCFQQAGLYFTQKPILQIQKIQQLKKIRLDYIKNHFNNKSQTNYKQISRNYIQKLGNTCPPIKSILPFLRLITIPQFSNRYDTTFFLHKLDDYKFINFLKYAQHEKYIHQTDRIIKCDNQFDKFRWMTPAEILMEFFQKQLSLAPPQYMLVNTMLRFHQYKDLEEYLKQSYSQNDTFGNISLGPNIVSLIPNNHPSKSSQLSYKYAATMLGDIEFPYKKHIANESCPQLKSQLTEWYQNRNIQFQQKKNRFLFNTNKQFFQDNYEVECQLQRCNLRKMMGFIETKGRLQKQIVL